VLSVRLAISSKAELRWLISTMDMPLPSRSVSSERTRSKTGSGSIAGPLLKL